MKLTTRKLKQMIKQELNNLNENLDYKDVGSVLAVTPAIVLAGLGIYDIADQSMLDREQLIQDVQMLSVEEIQQNLENSEYFKNLNARKMGKNLYGQRSGVYDELGIDYTQSENPGADKPFQIEVQSEEMAEKIKNLSPEELDQLLNIRALQNVLRYDMPKSDSSPLSIDHRGPFKENKMKLTSKKLKQMIREAMGSYTESEQGLAKPERLAIKMTPYDMMPPMVKDTIDQVRAAGFDVGRRDGIYNHYRHAAITPLIYIVPEGEEPMTNNYIGTIRATGKIETRQIAPAALEELSDKINPEIDRQREEAFIAKHGSLPS